jgi:hypothetical protein
MTTRRTDSNPFATRYVRPGAIPFLFPAGDSAEGEVARFASLGRRAQIVGPHGVGKSTLVATLMEPMSRAGLAPLMFALHGGQRRMPSGWRRRAKAAGARTIVIDGYEQLGAIGRWLVRGTCRRRGWGLLVTAHAVVGLPTLRELEPRLDVATAVVRHLMHGESTAADSLPIEACFRACQGNMRETVFALFDEFERRRLQEARQVAGERARRPTV